MSASILNLSARQLHRAADIKDTIQSLENELSHILNSTVVVGLQITAKPKRKMSAATRKKMAAAAKIRWAKINGQNDSRPPKSTHPTKIEITKRISKLARGMKKLKTRRVRLEKEVKENQRFLAGSMDLN